MIAWLKANPVIWLDAMKFLLAGGAVLGWWTAPASAPTDVYTAAAALAFALLTKATHASVTPVKAPQS